MLEDLFDGFASLLTAPAILLLVLGALWGIVGGALPGISTAAALVLALPLTFGMEPALGLILLAAVYTGGAYGGSISATLLNTPGTPEAAIMTYDGYALTQKGQAGKALWTTSMAALLAGVVGTFVLIFAAAPLADVAVSFGPPEYVALAILGLASLAMLGGGSVLRATISVVLGVMIALVGLDPLTGAARITFGNPLLLGGLDLIQVLIGLFAVSEALLLISSKSASAHVHNATLWAKSSLPRWRETRRQSKFALLGTGVGTVVGVLPGGGATIASIISYNAAKQLSSFRENFGKGQLEGLSAPEGADKASVGGALIPALAIGIPGSASSAVLLGGLTLNNIQPGPQLMTNESALVNTVFAALLVANFVVFIVGLGVITGFVRVTNVSKPILGLLVLVLSLVGAYATATDISGMWVAIAFGVIGYLMKIWDIPTAPVILTIVLTPLLEINLRRSLLMSGGDFGIFTDRFATVFILVLAVVISAASLVLNRRTQGKGSGATPEPEAVHHP